MFILKNFDIFCYFEKFAKLNILFINKIIFFLILDNAASCSPNPCNNGGKCSIKFLQIECECQERFFGKLCEFTEEDTEVVVEQFSRIISDLQPNLTDSQIRKVDELNTLINQNPSFATKNMTDQIKNLTCKIF